VERAEQSVGDWVVFLHERLPSDKPYTLFYAFWKSNEPTFKAAIQNKKAKPD
tara:strand:- start:808 stop:963 length:156 start_codon:yes stop_codon:yes gene_type:complete